MGCFGGVLVVGGLLLLGCMFPWLFVVYAIVIGWMLMVEG